MNIVPVDIRPHLVNFLMREFEGIEANYYGKRVKSCKLNNNSILGFIFRLMLEKSTFSQKNIHQFKFFLHVQEFSPKSSRGQIYKVQSGKTSFLKVPENQANDFNDILENLFRISFIYYVKGYATHSNNQQIKEAILSFMDIYSLYDFDYNEESLRRLYNRYSKGLILKRLQHKPSKRTKGQKSMSE